MIQNYLIIGAASALLAFGGAWKVQGWRYGEQINEIKHNLAEQRVAAVTAARTEEKTRYEKVLAAERAAKQRSETLARDAAGARAESNRLRDELAAAKRRVPQESTAAIRERTALLTDLLGDCSENYQGMAGTADRLANDVRTLIEAWPR